MKIAATYNRVSTKEQAMEGYSLEAQTKEMKKRIEEEGWIPTSTYTDDGYSGKNIEGRPQMKQLLKDAKERRFNVLVIHRIDRLSRNFQEALSIVELLMEHDIQLVSVTENINLTSSMGKLLFQLMGAFAEFERETISDRVKFGMTERAKQGKFNGGVVLGYDSRNGQLTINEKEAEIVRTVFRLACQNKGYKAIANELNLAGMKTKKGNLFAIATVKGILENPIYIGKYRYNLLENWEKKRRKGKNPSPILVDGEHEPIISKELWDEVQDLKQKRSRKSVSKRAFILSGLIPCPSCGYKMVAGKSQGHNYYVCGQYHNKGSKSCKANSISANRVEEVVERKMVEFLEKNPFDKINETKIPTKKAMTESAFSKKRNRLITLLSEGTISYTDYCEELNELNKTMEDQKEISKTKLTDIKEGFVNATSFQKRDLMKLFIRKITIIENDQTSKKEIDIIEFYSEDEILKNTQSIKKILRGA